MPVTPESTRVGFVGLGIMGAPMARNLIQAGYRLTVYNRTDRPRVQKVVDAGAERVSTPRDVARNVDVVITMVTDSPDVEQVVLGEDGIIHGAASGAVVIDMTTMSPRVTREIAGRLEEKHVEMLDAPVSGGDVGARNGTLSIMAGGKPEVFQQCLPLLQVLGENINLIGDHGAGQTTKLCNQVAGALNNLAVAEALMLAAASGLDLQKVLAAISGGAAGSWMMSNIGPKILAGEFAPGFMVDLQQKDLKLVVQTANDVGVSMPGVSLVHQCLNAVQHAGLGQEGIQALIKAYELQHGIQARS